jgi:hypothetical protein
MERGIDRALGQIECARAAVLDRLDDGVAVRRSGLERGKDDGIEVPLEHFSFHT